MRTWSTMRPVSYIWTRSRFPLITERTLIAGVHRRRLRIVRAVSALHPSTAGAGPRAPIRVASLASSTGLLFPRTLGPKAFDQSVRIGHKTWPILGDHGRPISTVEEGDTFSQPARHVSKPAVSSPLHSSRMGPRASSPEKGASCCARCPGCCPASSTAIRAAGAEYCIAVLVVCQC
jgi:hypothetical protein